MGNCRTEKRKLDQREIDLIVETDTHLYVGECEWSSNKMGNKELNWLQQSASKLRTKKNIRWALFNRSGFSISETNDILLFDPIGLLKSNKQLDICCLNSNMVVKYSQRQSNEISTILLNRHNTLHICSIVC